MPGRGSEASATCWNWICRCISWVRKHLQFAGIGFADAWLGLEASATCWNWICRCLVRIGSICNLLELDLQIHIGVNSGRGSICNLLELDLQMPGRGWKHPQLAGYEFADAYYQVDIKNPTTIAVGLFFMSKKEQNVLMDLRSILC